MKHTSPYLLEYYKLEKLWDVNMVHRVNNRKRFELYADDPNIHMLEVDIEDTSGLTDDLILQHGGSGDVPVIWALQQLVRHKKALKIDLKLPKGKKYLSAFYSHVLNLVREHWDPRIPLWVNVDTLKGPNWEKSDHECLDAADFIQLYNTYYQDNPNAMLSLGYLTSHGKGALTRPYDFQMLQEMREVIKKVEGSVTIALRYTNLMADMSFLQEYTKLGYVTIWNSRGDGISNKQFNQLAKHVQSLDVFKDLTSLDGKPMWG